MPVAGSDSSVAWLRQCIESAAVLNSIVTLNVFSPIVGICWSNSPSSPLDYHRPFGNSTARDLVREHVLRLTYIAHDMAPFARDLGYEGPP